MFSSGARRLIDDACDSRRGCITDDGGSAPTRRRPLVADVVQIVADYARSMTARAHLAAVNKTWSLGMGLSLAAGCVQTGMLTRAQGDRGGFRLHVSNEYAMSRLRRIDGCPGSDGCIARVCRGDRRELQHLCLTEAFDWVFEHIKNLRCLQSLDVSNCLDITDSGLALLKEMPQLQALNLAFCREVSDAGLEHVGALQELRLLNVSHCPALTDAGLACAQQFHHLETLLLAYCTGITDTTLDQVKGLPKLHSLDVIGCWHVTGCGLALVSHVPVVYS